MAPGGFILIDNVSQAGPYYAAMDFLAAHPDWTMCAARTAIVDRSKAYDPDRTSIEDTDLIVLRAPGACVVGPRPRAYIRDRRIPGVQDHGHHDRDRRATRRAV